MKTGQIGNLDVNFSRQEKQGICNKIKNMILHREYLCMIVTMGCGSGINIFEAKKTRNKTVLLREIPQEAYRPRHNLLKHMLSQWGYPIPGWGGGGTPSWPDWGYPILTWPRVGVPLPPGRDLGPFTGGPPEKDVGPVEVLWDGDGVPPLPRCGQTDTCENSTFPSYYVRAR